MESAEKYARRSALRATVFELGAEPGDDLSHMTTAEERLRMLDVLSQRMWELSGLALPGYSRDSMPIICIADA